MDDKTIEVYVFEDLVKSRSFSFHLNVHSTSTLFETENKKKLDKEETNLSFLFFSKGPNTNKTLSKILINRSQDLH